MNRSRVAPDSISFKEYEKMKMKQSRAPQPVEQELDLDFVIRIFNDKRNIKSKKEREVLAKQLFLEYMDMTYNTDNDFL